MQKCIALLLLMITSSVAFAMKDDSFPLSRIFSSSSINWVPRKSNSIRDLRKSKKEFEKLLIECNKGVSNNFCLCCIKLDKNFFLVYCYNQKFCKGVLGNPRKELDDLLNTFKEVQIDGYSALGAALLTKGMRIEDKRRFILRLMRCGFTLTKEDKALAALELYETIPAKQKATMICLLRDRKKGYVSMLPHDVRKYIVYCMIGLFKEELWVLPV